jgi:hypothetical protein
LAWAPKALTSEPRSRLGQSRPPVGSSLAPGRRRWCFWLLRSWRRRALHEQATYT